MAVVTQLTPYALPGQRYASFANKVGVAAPAVAVAVEEEAVVAPGGIWRPPKVTTIYYEMVLEIPAWKMIAEGRVIRGRKSQTLVIPSWSFTAQGELVKAKIYRIQQLMHLAAPEIIAGGKLVRRGMVLKVLCPTMTSQGYSVINVYRRMLIRISDENLGIPA